MDHREDKTPFSRSERKFIEALERRRDYLTRPDTPQSDWKRQEAAALKWAIGELSRIPIYRKQIQRAGATVDLVMLENAGVLDDDANGNR